MQTYFHIQKRQLPLNPIILAKLNPEFSRPVLWEKILFPAASPKCHSPWEQWGQDPAWGWYWVMIENTAFLSPLPLNFLPLFPQSFQTGPALVDFHGNCKGGICQPSDHCSQAQQLELVTLPLFGFLFHFKEIYFRSLILQSSWTLHSFISLHSSQKATSWNVQPEVWHNMNNWKEDFQTQKKLRNATIPLSQIKNIHQSPLRVLHPPFSAALLCCNTQFWLPGPLEKTSTVYLSIKYTSVLLCTQTHPF